MLYSQTIATALVKHVRASATAFCLLGIAACVTGVFAQENIEENRTVAVEITNLHECLAVASRFVDLKCDATFADLDYVEQLGRKYLAWMETNCGEDSPEAELARYGLEELSLIKALPPAEQSRYRKSLRNGLVNNGLKKFYATIPPVEEARSLQQGIKADAADILGDWQTSEWHRWSACLSFRRASLLALLVGDTKSAERWIRIPAQESLSSKGLNATIIVTSYHLGNYLQILEAIPNSAPLRSELLDVYYQRLARHRPATPAYNDQILQFNAYSAQASYDGGDFENADRLFSHVRSVVEEVPEYQTSIFANLRAWIPRYEAQRLHDRGDYAASREKIQAAIPLTIAAAEEFVGLPAPLLLRELYTLDASNCRMLGLREEEKARQQQADEITAKFEALQREVKVDFDTILGDYAKQFRTR